MKTIKFATKVSGWKRFSLRVAIQAGILLAANLAHASVCVRIDTTRDNLGEQERQAARMLLAQALERSGQEVVTSGCEQEYAVFHVKLGNNVSVTVIGPQGYRQANARGLEDLPNWYDQMVRSLLSGIPMAPTNSTVTRANVAPSQMAPNRVEADSLWYVRLGYGATFGGKTKGAPALGFGYRYELDNFAIDFSFLNLMIASQSSSNNASIGATVSWIRLEGLYFFNPLANGSTYLGAGLGWGASAAARASNINGVSGTETTAYAGSGLEGQVTAGYEFLRASTIRIFAQADLTLPLYTAKGETWSSATSSYTSDTLYLPTVTLSLGIGWGKGTSRVHVIQ
jgi:hypothetical protein